MSTNKNDGLLSNIEGFIKYGQNQKYLSKDQLSDRLNRGFGINTILKHFGYQNKPLDFDTAYLLGVYSLSPYVKSIEGIVKQPKEEVKIKSLAALCTLHNKALYEKKDSPQQIAGICAAVFDYDIGESEFGFLNPNVTEVSDNCGMGGDLIKTPNLSTIAALIASADGIAMLKHGSPGNTDNVGSSDFLKYAGVNLFADKKTIEECTKELSFAYSEALETRFKMIHTMTHNYAHLAHMNDIIGPITNPVNPKLMKKRVLGVNHLIPTERIAEAYKILNEKGITNIEHGLFVRGYTDIDNNGGIDEVSLMNGGTVISELNGGNISTYRVFANDFGLKEITKEQLHPGADKAMTSMNILKGIASEAHESSAIANASLLFYLYKGTALTKAVEDAKNILVSGKPFNILQSYSALSNKR